MPKQEIIYVGPETEEPQVGKQAGGGSWLIWSSLHEALKRFYGSVTQDSPVECAEIDPR